MSQVAVVEKPVVHEVPKVKRQPRYNVILLDDQSHSGGYVVFMLTKLFGYSYTKAYKMTKEVDSRGRVIVLTTTLEHAELKRDQILGFGPDFLVAHSKGSMSATIEPLE